MTELKWQGVPLNVVPGNWYTIVVPTVRAVLVDEANNPVVGQECVITGPNGFRVSALTDSRGRVSIPAPVGEEYHISFVHLDQDVWVVASKEGATAATASEIQEA